MERSEIIATMGELKLYGMRSAFDQIVTGIGAPTIHAGQLPVLGPVELIAPPAQAYIFGFGADGRIWTHGLR